jgi:integrase
VGKAFQTSVGEPSLVRLSYRPRQRLTSAIAKENPYLGHKTLLRLKSFLSGVFRHARVEGYLDDENPVRDVSLPRSVRRVKFKGDTYTTKEITTLLVNVYGSDYLARVAFAAVATAAFTGLRLAELRGLQWRDFTDNKLSVERTVWRTKEGLPKTESSENTDPVLPRRVIVPRLTRCSICQVPKHVDDKDHAFELDESIPKWKGWHRFRRLLASNLYTLGVKPKVVRAILRHSDSRIFPQRFRFTWKLRRKNLVKRWTS